jgi:hypothetical protein
MAGMFAYRARDGLATAMHGMWGSFGTLAALAENGVLTLVLGFLALGSTMMLESTWKKVILPLGKYAHDANAPGTVLTHPVQYLQGQPGVKVGQ